VLPNNFDELDALLKLREEINMLAEGNCSVYVIISQLHPQTYGGYRLSPVGKSYEEMDRTITRDKNVQIKVNEISNVAKTELYKKNAVEYVRYKNDKLDDFDSMVNDSYLTINHLQGITHHYRRVIILINTDLTQRMACIIFPDEKYTLTASLHKQKEDMSLYHVQLKDKFKDGKCVSLKEFLKYVNKGLYSEFTKFNSF
jgi:hypothetical protein